MTPGAQERGLDTSAWLGTLQKTYGIDTTIGKLLAHITVLEQNQTDAIAQAVQAERERVVVLEKIMCRYLAARDAGIAISSSGDSEFSIREEMRSALRARPAEPTGQG